MNTIVQGLYDHVKAGRVDLFPVLADALEESGFDNVSALLAMRENRDGGFLWKTCPECTGGKRTGYDGQTGDCYYCDGKGKQVADILADLIRGEPLAKAWLIAYAEKHCPYDVEEPRIGPHPGYELSYSNHGKGYAAEQLLDRIKEGEVFYHGSDLHGREGLEDEETLADACEQLLGERPDFSQFSFSCSC